MTTGSPEGKEKSRKVAIAVVSPFVDRRHGTERCLAEQIERLAADYEIHLFSNRANDLDLKRIRWHRVPEIPGPHLFQYLFWLVANGYVRRRAELQAGRGYALVYSPGVNCFDADVVQVHIVFAEFYRRVGPGLRLARNPVRSWPRVLHRRLYYRLIMWLEGRVYRRQELTLAGISRKTGEDLRRWYGVTNQVPALFHGIDHSRFHPRRKEELREEARRQLGLAPAEFAILLVGNDWKKKGLDCLLEAMRLIDRQEARLLIAGEDDRKPFAARLAKMKNAVSVLPVREDVEFYYAAADVVASPSIEDAFSLPPLEAMGLGVPVIVSRKAGVSEIITHGCDGLILEHPEDAEELAVLLKRVMDGEALRRGLACQGTQTAGKFTWEANAEQMKRIFEQALAAKRNRRQGDSEAEK